MKKTILSGFIALTLLFSITSCHSDNDDDDEYTISSNDLPKLATIFVTTYFPTATYKLITKQRIPDSDGSIYDVLLSNNFEIDFDKDGNWIDIDGNNQAIPVELIPAKINAYVKEKYPDQSVTAIDNEKTQIEIELSNNLELVFDLEGNFIRIDK
ncbi:PepSY-like domain-containing protein [Flavobacterium branchiarum]|uniref:PepSY-like domain-containing protein n=1 Tax=Flavobacterium branchiarum TaxID=1114870 RepID=A0ABV5FM47_9FLAO|nr:PepSY-like domain-containing protein [Flavobacterium branchiarum]MDN3674659.1 PepSY-like domain-containing protein [Flavobacterium branchiarum]